MARTLLNGGHRCRVYIQFSILPKWVWDTELGRANKWQKWLEGTHVLWLANGFTQGLAIWKLYGRVFWPKAINVLCSVQFIYIFRTKDWWLRLMIMEEWYLSVYFNVLRVECCLWVILDKGPEDWRSWFYDQSPQIVILVFALSQQ